MRSQANTLTAKSTGKTRISNSALAFVLAGMIETTAHELSHLTAALVLGDKPDRLYPNFVITPDATSAWHQILIAGTGPIFSMVTGLLGIWWLRSWLKGSHTGFSKLLAIWLAFLSAETGFGYFLIAPFVSGGDTGQVLHLLNAPGYMYALVCAFGAAGVYLLLPKLFAARVSMFAHDKKSFFQLGMHPFWIGTIALVVIYLAIEAVITRGQTTGAGSFGLIFALIGIATIGIFTPLADYAPKSPAANSQTLRLGRPTAGIAATVIVALGLIFGLAHGFSIG